MAELKAKNGVAICGGSWTEAWLMRRAFGQEDAGGLRGVYCDSGESAALRAGEWGCTVYGDFESAVADPDVAVLVLLDPLEDRTQRAVAALDAGRSVLLGAPFAYDLEEAKLLHGKSNDSRGSLMCAEPWMFFEPMDRAVEIALKKNVGRPNSVRFRSVIGGAGGWDTYLNPDFRASEPDPVREPEKEVMREFYEKLSLAYRLFGPITEIHAIPGVRDGRGTSVVTWKHEAHTTYGVLEVTFAPGLEIRSAYYPREDNTEISGTAGIIWVTRGCSQMRREPTLHIYRGENEFSYGNLKDDWQTAYDNCALYFADCAAKRGNPELYPYRSMLAVTYADAAARSAATGERIKL